MQNRTRHAARRPAILPTIPVFLQGQSMQRGVAYGVMAGALWGMVFLVPRVLPDFSPLLLSAGRYTMYGIVSLAAALPMARSLVKRLTREDLGALVKLALAGNLALLPAADGGRPSDRHCAGIADRRRAAGHGDAARPARSRRGAARPPRVAARGGDGGHRLHQYRRLHGGGQHAGQRRHETLGHRLRGRRARAAGRGSRSKTPAICSARRISAATSGRCCGAW